MPYRHWAKELSERSEAAAGGLRADTIVTFNYDLVLERLGLRVLLPSEAGEPPTLSPVVLKLHGSVDWRRQYRDGVASFARVDGAGVSHLFVDRCPDEELAIGTPGPTKAGASSEFAALWKAALNAIQHSSTIVFIGYRFPPTDAEARARLLGAIQSNMAQHLSLHIVLGPDGSRPDVVRLAELLNYAAQNGGRQRGKARDPGRTYRVKIHRLWAEDFLGLFSRHLLIDGDGV